MFSNRLSPLWLIVARSVPSQWLALFGMRHSPDRCDLSSQPYIRSDQQFLSAQTQSEIHYCSH